MYEVNPEAERKEIIRRYRNLIRAWKSNINVKDERIIRKAFNLALEAHKDMRRKSGEPYIYHPIEVARIVAGDLGLGETSIICALLHDVVEDTEYMLDDIRTMFNDKIAQITDGLTKIKGITDDPSPSRQAENFKKILLTLSIDVRVILIKLADRLHNMRTLDSMPPEKQLKIASETSFLYAPLAHRLGLYAIKSELEDLALKYTEPEIYNTLSEKLKSSELERHRFISKFIYPIKKELADKGIDAEIISREKSIFSIWKKMQIKEIPFEEVYDIFAIRIVLNTPFSYSKDQEKDACWQIYTIVTKFYSPKHNRLRDWISTPKANGYESLHTTVMSHTGRWVEVQIRTRRMDEIAEKGWAAHWKYKEAGSTDSGLDKWLNRIRELLQSSESNALDFLDDFKLNLFSEEIFIFTPKGDLRTLPSNSTALDFAYSIHSQIGNKCIGAKVNHKLVPLSHLLRSGDQVEIITSKNQKPKENWIDYVATARAKSKIKEALREEKKLQISAGKEILEQIFNELHLEFIKSNITRFQEYNHLSTISDLYYKVAKSEIGIKELKSCCHEHDRSGWLSYIRRPFTKSKPAEQDLSTSEILPTKIAGNPEDLLLKGNLDKLEYKIATCCNPIPGDDVIGIVETNRFINIHRTNCQQAIQLMARYGNRIVKAKWTQQQSISFLTGIKITGIDKLGFINDITKVITENLNLNMRSIHFDSNDGVTEGVVMFYVNNTKELNDVILSIKKINGISKVARVN